MSNIITFETAVKLKEAGFHQPAPQVGHIWYGLIGGYSEINMIVSIKDKNVFIDIHGNQHLQEAFDKFGTYAPTVGDLLKEMPDCRLSYYKDLFRAVYLNMEDTGNVHDVISNEHSVEACAHLYLKRKTI